MRTYCLNNFTTFQPCLVAVYSWTVAHWLKCIEFQNCFILLAVGRSYLVERSHSLQWTANHHLETVNLVCVWNICGMSYASTVTWSLYPVGYHHVNHLVTLHRYTVIWQELGTIISFYRGKGMKWGTGGYTGCFALRSKILLKYFFNTK